MAVMLPCCLLPARTAIGLRPCPRSGRSASADGVPLPLPHRIGLDTGACFGGPLTALSLPPLSADPSDPAA